MVVVMDEKCKKSIRLRGYANCKWEGGHCLEGKMMWGNKKDQHQRTKKGRVTYQRSDDEIDGIAGNTISDYQISEKGSQTGNQKLEVKQKENKNQTLNPN